MNQIVDTSGIRYMRFSGEGQAGWFVRELPEPLMESAGQLRWTWRVAIAPRDASVTAPATNDAALCAFVVFGRYGRFLQRPRVLFYTLDDGEPPTQRRDSPFVVRIAGRPDPARDGISAAADPFLDYRRFRGDPPHPISAIGVMQDTDQTWGAAIGDVMNLHWRSANAAQP